MHKGIYCKIGGSHGVTLKVQESYNVEFLIVDERRDYIAGRYRGFEKTARELEKMVNETREKFSPYSMTAFQSIDRPEEIVIRVNV